MANTIPTELSGLLLAIRLGTTQYKAQRTRIHVHGDTGDVTSGEDGSKKRIGTVPDWEVTITKASFDPLNNPWDPPLNLFLFYYITQMTIFPGGVAFGEYFQFVNGIIDDLELDQDANMLQPFTFHVMSGAGTSPALLYPI